MMFLMSVRFGDAYIYPTFPYLCFKHHVKSEVHGRARAVGLLSTTHRYDLVTGTSDSTQK